jgi:hypothetical protein
MIKCLPSMLKAVGSVYSTVEKTKTREQNEKKA